MAALGKKQRMRKREKINEFKRGVLEYTCDLRIEMKIWWNDEVKNMTPFNSFFFS